MTESYLWADLVNCLSKHDWNYEFSDDHSVWSKGVAQAQHIQRMVDELRQVNPERVASILLEHSRPGRFQPVEEFTHAAG